MPFVDFFKLGDLSTVYRKLATFCLAVYPLTAIVLSAFLGGLLAAVEGQPFSWGFVLALGELTATGVTAGGAGPAPATVGGDVRD